MLNIIKINFILLIFFSVRTQNIITLENNTFYQYKDYNKLLDIRIIIDKIYLDILISENDKLDVGLEIHEISKKGNMPLVIMGHSGIGSNALFNALEYLKVNDEVKVYKDYKENIYKINKIDKFDKGSKLSLPKNKDYLYLITCDKYNMKKQLILSAKLVDNS